MATKKISQLTPKGANLAATDLLEISEFDGSGYVTKSITGQEIIDSAVGNVDWGDIGGTLSDQTDLQTALNGKQATLVSGTNIKTINGTSVLGSGDISISTGLTVGTTPITSGTIGRVLFQGTGNVLQQSSSLFWDSTNARLGIGTSSPVRTLDVQSAQPVVRVLATTNTNPSALVFNNFAGDFWVGRESSTGNSLGMAAPAYAGVINARGNYPLYIGRNDVNNITITTSDNVLINTTTDAGFKLDVNGTARVSSSLRVESSFMGLSSGTIGGTTLAANANFQVNGSNKYVNYNSSYTSGSFLTYQAFGTWEAIGADSPAGTILALGGYRASQWTGITFHSSGSERMRIFSTGNIGINTTTDAGFKLDVNGTARVSSTLGVGGSLISGGSGFGNTMLSITSTYPCFILNSTSGTPSKVGLNLASSQLYFSEETNNSSSWGHRLMADTRLGGFVVLNNTAAGSTASLNTSAVLQADSTTRGFLPPRMTTTQKNAIATPATGLQVFDTTLNQMSYYNGTTWINL